MNSESTAFINLKVLEHDVSYREEANHTIYIKSNRSLEVYPQRITERLIYWAKEKPDTVFLGQRNKANQWTTVTYNETWQKVECIAQFLLNIGLSAEKPIAILADNSIEHALIALAALHVGIPYSPINPGYLTRSKDYMRLNQCLNLLNPELIFVPNGKTLQNITAVTEENIQVIAVDNIQIGQLDFNEILKTKPSLAVAEAYEKTSFNTISFS